MKFARRLWLLAAGAVALPLAAQQAPVDPASPDVLNYIPDATSRMTVPVSIGGSGPYRFLVDTGSERTVISRELAVQLQLGAGTTAQVHSMTEVSDVRTAIIPSLDVGARRVSNIQAPMLERRHLGAEGMLGVDSLQQHRVLFDFGRRQMQISPSRSREERWPDDAIVITGRRVMGRLVLVDADVEGTPIRAIVDTGAEVSIGNDALRRRLERRGRLGSTVPILLTSVTGGQMIAQATTVSRMRIGGIIINDMPIAFSEVHPFRKLGLTDRPALLLGMDALMLFDRVSIDFANHRVRVLPLSQRAQEVRLARRD
jgi:predicted aspartyl protease